MIRAHDFQPTPPRFATITAIFAHGPLLLVPLLFAAVLALSSATSQASEQPGALSSEQRTTDTLGQAQGPAHGPAHELAHRFATGEGGQTAAPGTPASEQSGDEFSKPARTAMEPAPAADERIPTAEEIEADLEEISRNIRATRRNWLDKSLPEPALQDPAMLGHPTRHSMPGLATQATILLVMKPGNRGIRRLSRSADPIVCIDYDCYISRGHDASAIQVSRNKAFGIANTLGRRAGACSRNTRCIFRNVTLKTGGTVIQPVDLRLMRHDRRAPRQVRVDNTCNLSAGSLRCQGLHTDDYSVWVIPEETARLAGSQALLQALQNDLRLHSQAALFEPWSSSRAQQGYRGQE